ncbi:MAG: hypothetical protein Q9227_005528 [Pyrenula ochraceoflavens]
MPPKRKPPASAASKGKGKHSGTKNRSKIAREHDITAEQEHEIKEAFLLFAQQNVEDFEDEKDGVLRTQDVRRAMMCVSAALNVAPSSASELSQIIEVVDPDAIGYVTYEHFVAVCALKIHDRPDEETASEVEAAYKLFTRGSSGPITVAHLKRIARELKEDVSEDMLRSMVLEANQGVGVGRGVNLEDFEGIMRRAGVF